LGTETIDQLLALVDTTTHSRAIQARQDGVEVRPTATKLVLPPPADADNSDISATKPTPTVTHALVLADFFDARVRPTCRYAQDGPSGHGRS
jgi:hypothetical protein